MSEPSNQKLLLAMTCAFGVVLVLVGFGRQKGRTLERQAYKSNSITVASPVEPVQSQVPTTTSPPKQANFASSRPLAQPESSWAQENVVDNYFDSSPLASDVSLRAASQHPIARKYDQIRQQINTYESPSARTNVVPNRPTKQFTNFSNIAQTVATSEVWPDSQTDLRSRLPRRDLSTAHSPAASHLSTAHGIHGLPTTRYAGLGNADQVVATQPTNKQTSTVRQSVYEAKPSNAVSPSIRTDKQVRKANWAEIEISPTDVLKPAYQLRQPTVLPPQHATPQMEAKAREQLRYGQSLARRRAFFAAREEFVRTLLMIANSYNTDANGSAYTASLTQALVALDEASDFLNFPRNSNSTLLQQKILSHNSRLLSVEDIETVTPLKAIAVYNNFAQTQLEQAIGYSSIGSEALHALGKLESLAPQADSSRGRNNETKTLVFYQAAFNINPANSDCANDLGVLLYDMGRLQESMHALQAARRTTPSEAIWKNLALVHNQLAAIASTHEERVRQASLANSAIQQAKILSNKPVSDLPNDDQWATLAEFQENAAFPNIATQNAANPAAGRTPEQGVSKSAKLKQKLKEWF